MLKLILNSFYRYYYKPFLHVASLVLGGLVSRLLASFVTFCFICLWHSLQASVLVWSILNFAGVTLEASARACGSNPTYQRIEVSLRLVFLKQLK